MTTYSEMIIKATKCNLSEVEEIEDMMRNDVLHSELDSISLKNFNIAAKKAYKLYITVK